MGGWDAKKFKTYPSLTLHHAMEIVWLMNSKISCIQGLYTLVARHIHVASVNGMIRQFIGQDEAQSTDRKWPHN